MVLRRSFISLYPQKGIYFRTIHSAVLTIFAHLTYKRDLKISVHIYYLKEVNYR